MINRDFLKEVLAEEKDLLELKDVKWINFPLFRRTFSGQHVADDKGRKVDHDVLSEQDAQRTRSRQRIFLQYSEHFSAIISGSDYPARKRSEKFH